MEVVLATNNEHKVEELRALLKGHTVYSLQDAGIDIDIEETGSTLEENALIKARAVRQYTDKVILADDTGLFVTALDGAPGVYSARYAGEDATFEDNNIKLLNALLDKPDRSAAFICAIAILAPGHGEHIVLGKTPGAIATAYAGESGFGYDPIFIEHTTGKTYGQMTPEEKNRCSHRALALQKAASYLDSIDNKTLSETKVLVVSDTHNRFEKLNEIASRHQNANAMIHLGDGLKEAYDVANLHNMPLHCVRGNNDHYHRDAFEKTITLDGQTLFLTHGHQYFVGKATDVLLSRAKEKKAAAALYGHTHRPQNEYIDGVLLFNPGSIAIPRGKSAASYGILTLSQRGISAEIIPR